MTAPCISGFRNEGANWQANRLYYFASDTGISYQRDFNHPNLFCVVYPDGSLSADCYNLTRVRQCCRDIAHALYPRVSRGGTKTTPMSAAGGSQNHRILDLGRGEYQPAPDTDPASAAKGGVHAIEIDTRSSKPRNTGVKR